MKNLLSIFITGLFFITACKPQTSTHPNVIIIMADDQGWGDLSLHGNLDLKTPNIDRIGLEGAQFENFYVSPVCSPTRAELLTGRYHFRSGVYSTSAGGERLNLDERILAQVFKKAGYKTALYGKWHSGMQYPYHPNARGFDDFYGFCSGHWGNYFNPLLEYNGELVNGKGFITDDLTDHALDFIESYSKRPFFIFLSLNTPHSPMQVPDRNWKPLAARNLINNIESPHLKHTRAALAMVENIDENVGRLINRLNALNLEENTLIIYLTDNGPNGVRWNGGMKGIKGSTDEGGTRSPLFIRWKNTIKPKNIEQLAGAVDLLPTLKNLTGINEKEFKKIDGIDLSPWILNHQTLEKKRTLVHYWKDRISLRNQHYRLDENEVLYDIKNDRKQKHPLSNLHTIYKELKKEKEGLLKSIVFPNKDTDTRPFILGHPKTIWTQLPSRDALFEGNPKRSNKYPNCTFITQWFSKEDKIYWNVEVPESGYFEVTLYYTCEEENVGSNGKITFNGSVLNWKISEPFDSKLKGSKIDRSLRIESYTKEFKPLKIGTLFLKKGIGKLTIQAEEVSRSKVMDLRMILFKRNQT